ncbi:hypothetical protein ACFSE1_04845 [Rhizobium helianthi]|uniref:Yip1 domain-containing protein n=1 Tax=Rhizobium helianthi TaxID=1132695 RepID=A0ABW4M0K1_9HYPH
MRLYNELLHPLSGIKLLAQGDARGLSSFDISDDGLIRSFRAILFCLPVIIFYAINHRVEYLTHFPDLQRSHAIFIFQTLVVEASSWFFSVLSVVLAGFLLDIRPLIRLLIVILNWATVPLLYAAAPVAFLLPMLEPPFPFDVLLAALIILCCVALLVFTWRVFHTVIGGPKWKRVAFLLLICLPPIVIVRILESSMRLTIP